MLFCTASQSVPAAPIQASISISATERKLYFRCVSRCVCCCAFTPTVDITNFQILLRSTLDHSHVLRTTVIQRHAEVFLRSRYTDCFSAFIHNTYMPRINNVLNVQNVHSCSICAHYKHTQNENIFM